MVIYLEPDDLGLGTFFINKPNINADYAGKS
jgi:hypothetical protein